MKIKVPKEEEIQIAAEVFRESVANAESRRRIEFLKAYQAERANAQQVLLDVENSIKGVIAENSVTGNTARRKICIGVISNSAVRAAVVHKIDREIRQISKILGKSKHGTLDFVLESGNHIIRFTQYK